MWVLLSACTRIDPFVIEVEGDPVPKRERPLAGGRAASGGQSYDVVASDENGDRIVVQPLYGRTEDADDERNRRLEIRLPSGWAPGAVSMPENELAAVVAQGAGRIVIFQMNPEFKIDLIAPVCEDPRDVVFFGSRLWITCGDGHLVEMDYFGGDILRSWFVAPELRHLYVSRDGCPAYVTTDGGTEAIRVDLETETIVGRYPMPSLEGDPDGASVARQISDAGDGGVFVLHESPSGTQLTRIPCPDDEMTTAVVNAHGALDVLAWELGDGLTIVPTPVVAGADVGGGPGAKTVEPFAAPDDRRVVRDRFSLVHTDAPVVGVAMALWGPVAVTRDPFSIVTSFGDGVPFVYDQSP